jgi:hypothetical protein
MENRENMEKLYGDFDDDFGDDVSGFDGASGDEDEIEENDGKS